MTETELTHDDEILAALKQACDEFKCSPAHFISWARTLVRWHNKAVIADPDLHPTLIDDAEITQENLAAWPGWVQDYVSDGSRWERLHWPDGSMTLRLVNPRGLVLGARHFEAGESIQRETRIR